MSDDNVELIATAAFGLEAVVSRELEQLGYADRTVADGRVTFRAGLAAICRTNLWLRSADRVLLKVGEFDATDFGELFDRTIELPWADWLPADAAFPVRGKTVRSALHSTPHCQSIVKKAIVESLRRDHRRDELPETGDTFPIEVALLRDRATLTIDTSGVGLHKRGYRTMAGPAPLKETLAAALVQLSFWNAERPLIDPLCGSGTIPIEAALIGRNRAPGVDRHFAAEQWPWLPARLWDEAHAEAADLRTDGEPLRIIGSDIDERVLGLARQHAQVAGVERDVHLQVADVSEVSSRRKYGCVITNPPYGERLGDRDQAESVYRKIAELMPALDTWSLYVLTAHPRFEQIVGRRSDRRRKLYNGRLECTYYQMHGPRPPRRDG